jgi:hypothetical protein
MSLLIEIAYSIDSENYFNSKSDYDNALVAAYDLLQSSCKCAVGWNCIWQYFSGESQTDVVGFQQVDDMIHTPVNSNWEMFGTGCLQEWIELIIF